VTNWTGK